MPSGVWNKPRPTVKSRLINKRHIDDDGCWIWTGSYRPSTSGSRYGTIFYKGKLYGTHRMSMHIYKGNVLSGSKDNVIDHKCRKTLCFNPSHLRVVSTRINSTENSLGQSAINKRKTHCKLGHPYSLDNTYYSKSKFGKMRACKICTKLRGRKKYAKGRTSVRSWVRKTGLRASPKS